MRYYKNAGAFFKTRSAAIRYFFTNDGGDTSYHTGIVEKVTADRGYTIEGNTSSAAGVVPNGGCVRDKSYPRNASTSPVTAGQIGISSRRKKVCPR